MFNARIRRDPDVGSLYQSVNMKLQWKNETENRVIITERMVGNGRGLGEEERWCLDGG